MARGRVGGKGRGEEGRRDALPPEGKDVPAVGGPGGPAVGDVVVIRARVHAIAAGGSLRCVETCTGGMLWVQPEECEPVEESGVTS